MENLTVTHDNSRIVSPISDELHKVLVVSDAILIILLCFGILVHMYGIYILNSERSQITKKISNHNIVLINLSLVEITLNLCYLTQLIIIKWNSHKLKLLPVVEAFGDALFVTHGCNTIFIAINRWLVLKIGVRYQKTITKISLIKILFAIWCLGLCFMLPCILLSDARNFSHSKLFRVLFHLCFITTTGAIYFKIYQRIKTNKRVSKTLFKQTQFLVISMIIVTFIVFFSFADIAMLILRIHGVITRANRHYIEHLFLIGTAFGVLSDAVIYIFFKPNVQLAPWKKLLHSSDRNNNNNTSNYGGSAYYTSRQLGLYQPQTSFTTENRLSPKRSIRGRPGCTSSLTTSLNETQTTAMFESKH